MPEFSDSGHDMYICQLCGKDTDSGQFPPQWRPDLTGNPRAGNVCPNCLKANEYIPELKSGAKMTTASLVSDLVKTAGVLSDDHQEINPELQRMVGDPDDQAQGVFSQMKPNPGTMQLPNPLSPIEGDEIFFMYLMPGAVFKAHDGSDWQIEAYDWTGQVEITNRWYPRLHAQVSVYDIRRSIHSWIEPIQQLVPPAPPGVRYDAQPVRVVD